MKTLLIGDVHGLISQYWKLLQAHKPERSIQLGDFGFRPQHEWHRLNVKSSSHRVLFGNHDDTSCLGMLHSLGDYGHEKSSGLFFVRGAESYDRRFRIENRDWWADEELSYSRFQQVIDDYSRIRPRIMLTHDCPQSVRAGRFGIPEGSRTSQALQTMFEIHQPELWVFGHHHLSTEDVYNGTRFRCLDELETMWIN